MKPPFNVDEHPEIFFSMSPYKKRPVIIHAIQMPCKFIVTTLEGVVKGKSGDWLIRGIEKEFYPCKNSVFVKTYDKSEFERKRRGKC